MSPIASPTPIRTQRRRGCAHAARQRPVSPSCDVTWAVSRSANRGTEMSAGRNPGFRHPPASSRIDNRKRPKQQRVTAGRIQGSCTNPNGVKARR